MLATLIQRRFAQLDENGFLATRLKNKVHETDRKKKLYGNKVREYRDKLLDLPDLE